MLLPILICISSYVSQPDARLLGSVANARGYDAVVLPFGASADHCDFLVMRGDTNLTYRSVVTFDDGGAPLHYRYQSLTRASASDLLTAWSQYERDVLIERAVAAGACAHDVDDGDLDCSDGTSDIYDLISEGL